MSAPETVLRSLNAALHGVMASDERVLVLGEDLLDPYGGAFKVTRGLSTAFPARVLTTPIAEAGFTGIACGLAMRGFRPVVEIMFGDFVALAADQLLNHVTKYPWMYDRQVTVPLVVRTPMGGRRGYGPTHSQSIEKHFLGMPGLVVVAVHPWADPGALLRASIEDERPVLFVENKLMYARTLQIAGPDGRIDGVPLRSTGGPFPTVTLSPGEFEQSDLTLVAYGGMAELAVEAATSLLMEHEIAADVVLPTSLNPLDMLPIRDSLARSGRLLVVEESTPVASFASELLSRVSAEFFPLLRTAPARVSARDVPIANTRSLEDRILPQVDDLVRAARRLAARPH